MSVQVFDKRACALGEGALWHPERQQLFWFDILDKKLLSQSKGELLEWQFDEHVSAAGWIDHNTLFIASESGLYQFDIDSGVRNLVTLLEADSPITRSNDGRADPWGGFWIGTMGKQAEPQAGSIYRWHKGQIKRLYSNLTITNAICFSPDKQFAYFTDTPRRTILRQNLDSEGWPDGEPHKFIDLLKAGFNPDGAVVDSEGCLWNAQWGASRLARYSPEGDYVSAIDFPASQISCPAFGGNQLTTLFATSALDGIKDSQSDDGLTFQINVDIMGQAEHRILL